MEERRSRNICLIASLLVHLLFALITPSLGVPGATRAKASPPRVELVSIEFPETAGSQPASSPRRETEMMPPEKPREVETQAAKDEVASATHVRRVAQPADLAQVQPVTAAPRVATPPQAAQVSQVAQLPQVAQSPQVAHQVAPSPQVAQTPQAAREAQVAPAPRAAEGASASDAGPKPPSDAVSVKSSIGRLISVSSSNPVTTTWPVQTVQRPAGDSPGTVIDRSTSSAPGSAATMSPSSVASSRARELEAAPAVSAPAPVSRPVLHREPPVYPAEARREGWEGRVRLEVLVSASGKVNRARVVESSGHTSLDKAARNAAMKWRFTPAETQAGAASPEPEPRFINIVFELK